jgi:3-oxoacyl-[acyl-carrier protein] reductase
MTMDFGLKGRHALVTGGSRGIGRAIVLALAQQGASVSACYATPSAAVGTLAAELNGLGANSRLLQADVRSTPAVRRFAAEAAARFGPIDLVVNNAAVVSHHTLADLEEDEWERIVDTNLTGMYRVTRAVLDHLAEPASIVNVTSAVAGRGEATLAHYTAAKAGVVGLTRSLCKELGPRGIRVNAIAPGLVATDQMSGMTAESRARFEARIPLRRVADPDELTGAVLFLASDAASYITGATLYVDGGI